MIVESVAPTEKEGGRGGEREGDLLRVFGLAKKTLDRVAVCVRIIWGTVRGWRGSTEREDRRCL